MKKAIVFLFLVCFAASLGWAEDSAEAPNPMMGLSIILTDSLAFPGLGLELFLGNLGLGATCTTMFLGASGATVIFLEPGAYGRFYFSGPAASLYLGAAVTYLTFFGGTSTSFQGVDGGLINLNGAIGFNAMFGSKKEFRFAIELGPRYVIPTAAGTTATGFIFPHFLLQFGMNF